MEESEAEKQRRDFLMGFQGGNLVKKTPADSKDPTCWGSVGSANTEGRHKVPQRCWYQPKVIPGAKKTTAKESSEEKNWEFKLDAIAVTCNSYKDSKEASFLRIELGMDQMILSNPNIL